jgi:hypothetical protein
MYYAILAYHLEGIVESWTPEEDAALMTDLLAVNARLVKTKHLGPAARLGPTSGAVTAVRAPAWSSMAHSRKPRNSFSASMSWIFLISRQPLPQPATSAAPIRRRSTRSGRFRSICRVRRWSRVENSLQDRLRPLGHDHVVHIHVLRQVPLVGERVEEHARAVGHRHT